MARLNSDLILTLVDKASGPARGLDHTLDRLNRRQRDVSEGMRSSNRLTAQAAAGMARAGAVLGPAALAYGAGAAVRNFATFERQMNRVGITAGSTAAQTTKAGEAVQGFAAQMAMPLDQALAGLDTLVSSGQSLDEALAFLPAVLKTAQATGAATEDIANTALKSASALGLQAGEMQQAFDVMVAGGKSGQFELKDMAAFIPGLANSFATLGYKGQDGLKQLIALLQTIREDTGTAEAAATQAQNIFGKMYSGDTAAKFKKFGIDLRKKMAAAVKDGEGAVDAFVRLSKEAVNGDMTKLPLLFTDQEFRLGMQSLMTSADSYKRFIDVVNSSEVNGTVEKDFRRIADDTEASIERMSGSWDRFVKAVGGKVASPVSEVLDNLSQGINDAAAADKIREERGYSTAYRVLNYASGPADAELIAEEKAEAARKGLNTSEAVAHAAQRNYANWNNLDGMPVTKGSAAAPRWRDTDMNAPEPAVAAPAPPARPIRTSLPPQIDSQLPARSAPVISAREAESASMAALVRQFAVLIDQNGSIAKKVTGADVRDEAGVSRSPVTATDLIAPRTAPVSAREAESSSMNAMVRQFAALLDRAGSFQKGVTGRDVRDEAGVKVDPAAMEAAKLKAVETGTAMKTALSVTAVPHVDPSSMIAFINLTKSALSYVRELGTESTNAVIRQRQKVDYDGLHADLGP